METGGGRTGVGSFPDDGLDEVEVGVASVEEGEAVGERGGEHRPDEERLAAVGVHGAAEERVEDELRERARRGDAREHHADRVGVAEDALEDHWAEREGRGEGEHGDEDGRACVQGTRG